MNIFYDNTQLKLMYDFTNEIHQYFPHIAPEKILKRVVIWKVIIDELNHLKSSNFSF